MNAVWDRTDPGHGSHTRAVLRDMARDVTQKDNTQEALRGKFMRAGWYDCYLTGLLALF